MVKVVVTGIGLISALGNSWRESWVNLLSLKTGIKLHQPFSELSELPLGLIFDTPCQLNTLNQKVVSDALADANLVTPLPNCAVVIGSSRGYQGRWENLAKQLHHSSHFLVNSDHPEKIEYWLNTLPHENAMAVARQISASGTVLAPMAACATGIWAIAQATMLIQTGQCQRAIAGAVEAPITPLTICGFQQMGALAQTGAYPFDLHREGFVLGEGGAVFILESAELAKQRQAEIYGEILGFGLTADAFHGNKPDPDGKSVISAIKQCLQRSHLQPQDIDYIHTHGTATVLNDKLENKVIRSVFPDHVAVSSTKGATGHTLGASGALGIAFSLLSLKYKILPPCVGLHKPEFNLNFVTTATKKQIEQSLCLSFGFGGQNAAIALGAMN
ncbi:MAG: beta-ketoacyl-ACP synthase [Sphaerospermopsis sp. SIO1G2]|nr:beta-ketoacyl-ACP synthase [Sphaerospermopsis sp. SIO1G1]NET72701.1 beta-ketoacyl-ACP synthase [Sphaerospermopsis sp. SIO1G2]